MFVEIFHFRNTFTEIFPTDVEELNDNIAKYMCDVIKCSFPASHQILQQEIPNRYLPPMKCNQT
jgi:hypothetical protein